eukprot:scaffold2438_cov69-Phaeocystis_antarctica.AAC.7
MAHTADAEDSLDLSAGGRARTVHSAPWLPRMLSRGLLYITAGTAAAARARAPPFALQPAARVPGTTIENDYRAQELPVTRLPLQHLLRHACVRALKAQLVLFGVHPHELQKSLPLVRALEHQDGCEGLRPSLLEVELQVARRQAALLLIAHVEAGDESVLPHRVQAQHARSLESEGGSAGALVSRAGERHGWHHLLGRAVLPKSERGGALHRLARNGSLHGLLHIAAAGGHAARPRQREEQRSEEQRRHGPREHVRGMF